MDWTRTWYPVFDWISLGMMYLCTNIRRKAAGGYAFQTIIIIDRE